MLKSFLFCISMTVAAYILCGEPLSIIKTKNGITIDGKLDEKEWSDAATLDDFRINGSSDKKASYPTSAKILYDNDFIYFGIRCGEPDPASLKMQNGKRDSNNVYWSDCVDIMIDPGATQDTYYHFIVSADGKVFDRIAGQGGVIGDTSWDCDAKAAAFVGKDFWACEIAIPFYALEIKAALKNIFAINICREKKQPAENSSIARGVFNAAPSFLRIELPDAELSRYCCKLSEPEFKLMVDGQTMKTDIKLRVENHSGKKMDAVGICALESASGKIYGKSMEMTLGTEKTAVLDFSLSVEEQGIYKCTFIICDGINKKPCAAKTVRQKIEFVPLKINIEKPFSGNVILSSQKLEDIVFNISLDIDHRKDINPILQVSVTEKNAGKKINDIIITKPERDNRLILKNNLLPIGTLEIKAILLDHEKGKELAQAVVSITKAPPADNEWWIDENHNIRHNEATFTGYGWYSGGKAKETENNNVNMDYGQAYLPANKLEEAVSRLLKIGIYSIVEPEPQSMYRKNSKLPLSAEEENMLRARIREIKNMPGLMGYYIGEEPDGCGVLPERLEKIYRICKEEDPYHLGFGVFAYADKIMPYVNTCDVIMVDPYPRFLEEMPPAIPISMVSTYMQICSKTAEKNRKSCWHVPQAFDFSINYPNGRNPNFLELRNQVLQGIIEGSKGTLWFTHRYRTNCPDIATGIPFIGKEIEFLRNAITAPEEEKSKLKFDASDNKEIHAGIKHYNGFTYIFTVNTSRKKQTNVKFETTELKDCELFVLSENRKTAVKSGIFHDDFAMYEGHIYTDDPAAANTETLDNVKKEIARSYANAVKNGNIAHKSTGCSVKVSSFDNPVNRPERYINDGFQGLVWTPQSSDPEKYIELDFHKTQEVSKVKLYGNFRDFEIMVKTSDGWKTTYSGSWNPAETQAVFPVQKTDCIRIKFKTGSISIKEIEAYSN